MSRGRDGVCPEWYLLIRAAKFLGVNPWELSEQPIGWMQMALEAESAERWAERERAARNKWRDPKRK